jgi:hypothetical protein
VLLLVAVQSAGAQQGQVQGKVSVVGGSATDVAGVTSRAMTVAPSLTMTPNRAFALDLAGSATRFDNQQWSVGGGATAAVRAPLGRFAAFTTNGGFAATTTSYDLSYATADALPALELSYGAVTAFGGAHVARATKWALRDDVSRMATGPVFGGSARMASDDGEILVAGYREERSTIDAARATDRTASLSVFKGNLAIGGSAGVRNEGATSSTFGMGLVSIGVSDVVALQLAAGSYLPNRLIGTPGGRFVNAGLSLQVRSSSPSLPKPEGIRLPVAGMTRFSIRSSGASRVELAGDFTNWKSISTVRAPNGVWYVDLRVPPGRYRYAFRIDGREWKVPDGAAVVDDDFGGKSALIEVRDPAPVNP